MPFTSDAFFDVFRSYNEHIWPAQLLLTGAEIAIVLAPRVRAWLLASLWVWCAIAYFWIEFTDINPAGWLFGALFLAGAFAFVDDNGAAEEVSAIRRSFG